MGTGASAVTAEDAQCVSGLKEKELGDVYESLGADLAGKALNLAKDGSSTQELSDLYQSLDADQKTTVREALGAARSAAIESAAAAASSAVAVAGENEDGIDSALTLELSKQEEMFLKCLRKRADRDRERKSQKEQKRVEQKAQKEKAMELAFENEVDALLDLFDKGVEPDGYDEHGTTLLSEAAGGNAEDVVELLLGEGADPNSLGRYHRTPLWRAAYAGNAGLIRMLLRSGSDPREPDEQGGRPIDVASNPESRELLLCWDTSATEKIQKAAMGQRQANAKKAEKEEREKAKRAKDELSEAIEEAGRKAQIARSELARARKVLQDYRQQKVSYFQVGEEAKLAELEPMIESAENKVKLYESSVSEWDWKMSRARLKQSDFTQQLKEKAEKKAGKQQGFKLKLDVGSIEDLDTILPNLSKDLEVCVDFEREGGLELKKGDSLIPEAPFAHLRKTEFNKKFLSEYGRPDPAEVEAAEGDKDEEKVEEEAKVAPFPLSLFFSRGFSRTIEIKSVADVLIRDVGDLRKADGRWPLVIDPSGRTSTFIQYTGAAVYRFEELQAMEPMRLRKALLKALMNGGCLFIDLGSFDVPPDVIEEVFGQVEKGLFRKFVDRSVLYSYLLPRRFKSLIVPEVQKEYVSADMFLDDQLNKFVLGFVTSLRDPDFDFAKQFYTISVRSKDDEDG